MIQTIGACKSRPLNLEPDFQTKIWGSHDLVGNDPHHFAFQRSLKNVMTLRYLQYILIIYEKCHYFMSDLLLKTSNYYGFIKLRAV